MSSEVGTGHVSIFPVLTGFKGKVTKGVKEAGAAGAKSFEGSFKGAGAKTGRALGRDLKTTLATAAGDLGAAQLTKLNKNVSSAAAALSRARLKQMDEAGRVRVAETRLQEAIAKYGEGSSQAIAADERLAAARRRQVAAADAVTAASTRLEHAQEAVKVATEGAAAASERAGGGFRKMATNLKAGWRDADAARSAFTGVAGSVGGVLKAVSNVTGLSTFGRLAKLTAREASTSFTSLASMVGGRLASAWMSSTTWMRSVGSSVANAFAPVGRVAVALGSTLASPFIKLGTGVASWLQPVTSQVKGLFAKASAAAGSAASGMVSSFKTGLAGIGSAAASGLQAVVSAASRAGSAAGQALASGLKNTATAGVAVAAAAVGVAFAKGVGRLTAIDTARAKLTGLGNDARTVKRIMGDALVSVRGTAFGLGEAASVAAAAVAAQIKPGKALQNHLKNIANNAAAAGMSMSEMGSIFNKAATQANGVQNDVIGQLADRGIPIYQELAKVLGVTAGEVFAMASRGEVDFETFSKAASKAAGTVADEMGKTIPGASANFFAAMGRIGANALEGVYSKVGPLIQAATSALAPIEERAKAFGAVLTTTVGPALDWLTSIFDRIASGAGLAGTGLDKIMGVAGPLTGIMAALGAGGLASVLARLGPLSALLGPLGGMLGALASPLGIVAAGFAGFALTGGDAQALVSGFTGIVDQVVAGIPGMVQQIITFVPALVSGILDQVPILLAAGVKIVQALVTGLVTSLPSIALGAVKLVQGLITSIVAMLPMIIQGAIQLVTALIQGIVTAIPLLISAAVQLVSGLLTAIVGALPMIIEGGIQLLMALITGIIGALPQLLTAALDLVMGLLDAIIENLPMIIDAGIQLLLSLVTGLIDALPQLITAAINLVIQLVLGLLKMLPKLIEAGIELVVSLIVGLVEAIPKIIEMLPQIISAIWDGLMGVDWIGLGIQIVMGIINGLGSMVGAVVDAIVKLASAAFEGFKDFFGIASPSKLMRRAGVNVIEGAVSGVEDEGPEFGDSLVAMAKSASARAQAAMNVVGATVSSAATSAVGKDGARGRARVLNYYAAPNQSFDEEQDLQLALEREEHFR